MSVDKTQEIAQKLDEKTKELEQKLEEMENLGEELSGKTEESSEGTKTSEPSKKEDKKVDEKEVLEKRFKDTQAAYTRARQEVAALKAEVEVLKQELQKAITAKLPKEKLEELENLKYENPDEWRLRMNELERMTVQQTLDNVFKRAEEVKQQKLKEMEQEIYNEFKQLHPDFDLNEVYDQLPLGLIKRYEQGKMDYAKFLDEAYNFIKSSANIKQPETPPKEVDLGSAGGSTEPEKGAQDLDINDLYSKAVF